MITFFVLLSGTAKKCFYFAERKMERKLKMDVKSNLDGDYIVKISSSKKGQYKPITLFLYYFSAKMSRTYVVMTKKVKIYLTKNQLKYVTGVVGVSRTMLVFFCGRN